MIVGKKTNVCCIVLQTFIQILSTLQKSDLIDIPWVKTFCLMSALIDKFNRFLRFKI